MKKVMGRGAIALGLTLAASIFGRAQASPSAAGVAYLPADKLAAAFAKGMPLVEVENYKVHASRREAPGQAEVHVKDTDIIYVLSGTATLVTGGTAVDGKSIGPEEIRGASIEGGEAREIRPGDVIIVPNGVAHWFKEVPGPLTYYVVKVRSAGGSR